MRDVPHGTVTFLFTDIEGSTRLWREYPDAMPRAYARHDDILRSAVRAEGGVVYKTIGDAFQVAFPTAIAGVHAALRAQQALTRESWRAPEPIRVRMALHTGAVDPDEDGDYRSPVLNRLGRLLDAGHGGQVLVSQATMELARDALPAGASLLDLGEHRLKDLARTERVYQLLGKGLPATFPPLHTLNARPNNLPTHLTPFIGRQDDVRTILGTIARPEVRLLTLTGPGGIGKTRLSLQVAADALDLFDAGVFFVRLDTITDPALVPMEIAQALGLREDSEAPVLKTLLSYLRDKRLLLVLDNLEQVIDAATRVSELLHECPGLKILVTSRIRLQVRGEYEHPVLPLQLPSPDRREDVTTISQYESVRLFVERARLVRPAFEITAENAAPIAEICTRLDGMPLAIELASARIRMLTPAAMLKRLSDRLSLLTGGARDVPARQQTLRGAIEWSYSLLDANGQALFRCMSVFAGGTTLEAIEQVAGDGSPAWDVFEGLERLIDHSLVRQVDLGGEVRFAMYETIREYAREQLEAHDDADATHRRHAAWIAELVDQFSLDMSQDRMAIWMDRMAAEQENLRSVMTWLIANDPPGAFHLIVNAVRFWQWGGHYQEGKSWIERVLALPREGAAVLDVANALRSAVIFVSHPFDTDRYLVWLEEAVELCRSAGDDYWLAHALSAHATLILWSGDEPRGIQLGDEALELARQTGDPHLIMWMLNNRANSYDGEPASLSEMKTYIEEMIGYFASVPDAIMTPWFQASAADYYRFAGDFERAERMYLNGLQGVIRSRLMQVVPFALMGLAITASETGRHERAAWIGGAESAIRKGGDLGIEYDRDMVDPSNEFKRALARASAVLGEGAYREAWQRGTRMALDGRLVELLEGRREEVPV